MNQARRYYPIVFFLLSLLLLLQNTRCAKEYSFEGAKVDTLTTGTGDTVISQIPTPSSQCNLCNPADQILLGHWSFKTGNVYQCGTFTNSGFFSGLSKTAFTFFGPSACSIDTGIVVSVYLPVALTSDQFNLTTEQTAFYYYAHNAPDILASRPTSIFSVTVQSFINATGIVTGTFSGTVFTANGDTATVTEGQFIAPLH